MEQLKSLIKQYTTIHLQGEKPNIFIFSTARSGSTWLMEVIASQRGIKFIDEPLRMTRFRNGNSPLPPSWDFLLPNPEREPCLERYFRDLINNRIAIGSPSPLSKFHRFISRRIVFKILGCKDMMNWFEERFRAQIVYLVRHPVPTSLSRTRYGLLPLFLANDAYCDRYLTPALREYGWLIFKRGSELQKKVLDWCLQNLPPLKFSDRSRWLCLHYEDLVMDPAGSVDKLVNSLELNEKNRLIRQISLPSTSVSLSDQETRRHLNRIPGDENRLYLVNKWRQRISRAEEEQAFEVLRRFDLDVYEPGQDMPAHRLQS
jgi:hypothetical protein